MLMFDAPLAPLVAMLAPRLRSVRAFVVLTDKGHMPQARARPLLFKPRSRMVAYVRLSVCCTVFHSYMVPPGDPALSRGICSASTC